jgi:hypothetical protein
MELEITRLVKDHRRFEWGLKEFFPDLYYRNWEIPNIKKTVFYIKYDKPCGRDGIRGYVDNFRDH